MDVVVDVGVIAALPVPMPAGFVGVAAPWADLEGGSKGVDPGVGPGTILLILFLSCL